LPKYKKKEKKEQVISNSKLVNFEKYPRIINCFVAPFGQGAKFVKRGKLL